MSKLLRIVIHALPIIPLLYGRGILCIAAILGVGLCYIKVYKLKSQLRTLAGGASDDSHIQELERALRRWESLTFLPSSSGENET